MATFLGIDLGTTQIKACLVDQHKRILYEDESPHHALVNMPPEKANHHEQSPLKILGTLAELLLNFDLQNLKSIAVSGQMHGVVLWNKKSLVCGKFEELASRAKTSTLVTWMDGRCDSEFLAKLPLWLDRAGNVRGEIATGYGMATLAWLKAHKEIDPEWDAAGTIMDFLVSYLIGSTEQNVLISTQNASAWGYSDDVCWTLKDDDSDVFPVSILPKIVPPGHKVGLTKSNILSGIPDSVTVYVGMGDLQTSLLPVLQPNEAVIHIGTSSQITFLVEDQHNSAADSSLPLRWDPYFDGRNLLVAASLNGGNSLACFIKQIATWSHQLFGTPENPELKDSSVLERLLNQPDDPEYEDLKIRPLFYGERHNPTEGASLCNWHANIRLDTFLKAIARGTIENLAQMMPESVLSKYNITSIQLINRAAHSVYFKETQRQFPSINVRAESSKNLSAAFGSAIFAVSTPQVLNN